MKFSKNQESKLILVSGIPGTGKTTLSKKLAKLFAGTSVDLHAYFIKHKLYDSYDQKRDCYVIAQKVISKTIEKLRKEHSGILFIDSHMSHHYTIADLCIITTCDIKVLRNRLKKRKYSLPKIEENMEAEIFEVCKMEALETGHKVLCVNTTKPVSVAKLKSFLEKVLRSKQKYHEFL